MIQSIKSVLVGLTEEGRSESTSALAYGLSLARAAGGHLSVSATSLRLALTDAFVSDYAAELVAQENRRLQALAQATAERMRGEASSSGVACSVESSQLSYAELVDNFVKQARVHDLSVLDAETRTIDVDRGLIERTLLDSGRPLIVVPAGHDTFNADRIVIAWDGSARAARAVNDAMPFLTAARHVDLVVVTGEKDLRNSVPGAELAPHLARHGVAVNLFDVTAKNGDVAETLRGFAGQRNADMMVMGAYVHSRLREWFFGGVTQSLFKAAPVPLFMSY